MKKLNERIESLSIPIKSIDGYLEIYPDENDPDLKVIGNEYVATDKAFFIGLSIYTGEVEYMKYFSKLMDTELSDAQLQERKNLRDIKNKISKVISKMDSDIMDILSDYGYSLE